jgi:hypothetical protein
MLHHFSYSLIVAKKGGKTWQDLRADTRAPTGQNTASGNTDKILGKTDPLVQCSASARSGVIRDACQLPRLN